MMDPDTAEVVAETLLEEAPLLGIERLARRGQHLLNGSRDRRVVGLARAFPLQRRLVPLTVGAGAFAAARAATRALALKPRPEQRRSNRSHDRSLRALEY